MSFSSFYYDMSGDVFFPIDVSSLRWLACLYVLTRSSVMLS